MALALLPEAVVETGNLCSYLCMRKLLVIAATFISLGTAAQPEPAQHWTYRKENPKTHKRVVDIQAASFAPTGDGHTFRLADMSARLYDSSGVSYKQISSKEAVIDEQRGTLAYGPNHQTVVKLR